MNAKPIIIMIQYSKKKHKPGSQATEMIPY